MQIPRRVPWASLAELEQLCEWIYSPDSTPKDRERALHRLSAWAAITTLPTSLASTLSLLTALSIDTPSPSTTSPTAPSSSLLPSLALRQTYALSLIRLVNSLVDPLQQGMYARPIAHIARQLGIPGWWVELRHMGTHDELPGLAVLREAAREALDWLYAHYFLPTLHSSAGVPLAQAAEVAQYPSAQPLLKAYKNLAKAITRDASLASRSRLEMDRLLRSWERWVSEVRVAISSAYASSGGAADGEEIERAALEVVSEALVEKGGLVPLSRRKRATMKDPSLPPELGALWSRLLNALRANHPLFASVLYQTLLSHLSGQPEGGVDSTADATLLAWSHWLVQEWADQLGGKEEALSAACVMLGETEEGRRGPLSTLVRLLAEGDEELEGKVEALLSVVGGGRLSGWAESDLTTMEERLQQLEAALKPLPSSTGMAAVAAEDAEMLPVEEEEVPGWRRLGAQEWTECPIGWVGA